MLSKYAIPLFPRLKLGISKEPPKPKREKVISTKNFYVYAMKQKTSIF